MINIHSLFQEATTINKDNIITCCLHIEENREMVISTMVNCHQKVLTDKSDYLSEEITDLHGAFKMLINDIKTKTLASNQKSYVLK